MTVERVAYIHDDEITDWMDAVQVDFQANREADMATVRKAISAVRHNKVKSYFYDQMNNQVTANVFSNPSFEVKIVFRENQMQCSCSKDFWCVHRLAVLFHLYTQYYSLTEWMEQWKWSAQQTTAISLNERTPASWNVAISDLMNPIRIIGLNENPAIFIHHFTLIEQKANAIAPFEWEWKPIFSIYLRLHALEAAWPYIYYHLGDSDNAFSFGKWYVRDWLTAQIEAVEDAVNSLSSRRRLFEVDPFLDDIRRQIRALAVEKTGLFTERFRIYRTCWLHLFQQPALREEEQATLQTIQTSETYPLLAFFYMTNHDYEQLTKVTSYMTDEHFDQWFALTEIADYEEDAEALSILMHALLPFIQTYLSKSVALSKREVFVRQIDGLLESANFSEEEREKMFAHYGSAGIYVYADFLVERARFKEWAALMHRYNVSYEIVEASGLKVALANDPEAVLPLLHHYALKFIEERNRQSYRRAVRVFRQMKNGAKKVGKQAFWNRYLETIQQQKRRLRALMEEIEKGNLSL